jgi:hypothetical protein
MSVRGVVGTERVRVCPWFPSVSALFFSLSDSHEGCGCLKKKKGGGLGEGVSGLSFIAMELESS